MQKQRIPRPPRSAAHGTLGRAVRELRARFDLSQEGLAFQAGLHRNYVGAIERGEINPTFSTLMRLALGIGVALSELIGLYETRSGHALPEPLVGAPAPRRRRR
jgi:transcriptional regulator with XRE-family HTH domain